jgi:DNA-directed RNA polymerase I, II, and III subunit RPABC3
LFKVVAVDADGKRFDRVSRLQCRSERSDTDLELDINIDLYPLDRGDRFTLALHKTLALDGTPDDGTFDQSSTATLADKYDYVMYGAPKPHKAGSPTTWLRPGL